MKKALLLCLGLFLLAAAHVQAAPANVNFTSERGIPFNLRFDGRPLTRGGARQVHINRISPGVHWAEFMIPTGYGRSINYRTRVFLDPGLETSFVLLTRPGCAPELRKIAAVPLRGGCRSGYWDNPNGGYYGSPQGGYQGGQGGNYYDDDAYGSQSPINPQGGYDNDEDDNGGYYLGGGVSYNRAMAPQNVDALLRTLQDKSVDSTKLGIAKEVLGQSTINAADLKLVLQEFSLESNKVDLAKFAYPRVADPQNFYQVYEAFDFESSIRDVQQAVGSTARRN